MGISVNAKDYTWSDIEFSMAAGAGGAKIVDGIQAVAYKHRTAIKNVYGAGRRPRSQAIGRYTLDEITMTFTKKVWQTIKKSIGNGWQGAEFKFSANYRNEGEPVERLVIEGRLSGEGETLSSGSDDETTVEVTAMPIKIDDGNGIDPVRSGGA